MSRLAGSLVAAGVSKSYGAEGVLEDVSLVVPPRARIGLVGPNGAGKSTLLRLLARLEEPDAGRIRRTPPELTVGYLAQERNGSGARSGGQETRAALSAVLRGGFDVLLLDEPTNDLDFAGLAWLERALAAHPGSVVVVSHDRAFLDRTVTRIVELDEWTRGTTEYSGGWSDYEAERERRRERHYRRWDASVAERRRVEEQQRRMAEWERRGYGQGRKKKKSKDVKRTYGAKLARIETVEKPYEPWELQLSLAPAARSGEVVVRLEGAVVDRGSFRLGPLDLAAGWGDRVAIAGPNGSGKTTLLDALLGRLPLAAGTCWLGPGVVLGELEQDRAALTGLQTLLEVFRDFEEGNARTLLAKFGLGADDVLRPAASLSPGERTRAGLALLTARGVNCLVLDEPTNHLDVEAIEELERGLAGYDGTRDPRHPRPPLPGGLRARPYHRAVTPTASIVTIGNELVSGDVPNTNAAWLARRLAPLGVAVRLAAALPDEIDAIAEFVRTEAPRVDFVLVTGGLGGTPDDLTREALAAAFAVPQEEVPEVAADLRARFTRDPEYAARWAQLPRGSRPLANPLGGAPGFAIENVFVLPGLPSEMEAMFASIEEEFRRGSPIETWRRVYRTYESLISSTLAETGERWPSVLVGSYPSFGDGGFTVEIVLKSSDVAALAAASAWLSSAIEEGGRR
jgi:molybdenum cofactor synthesis domain-containing protein